MSLLGLAARLSLNARIVLTSRLGPSRASRKPFSEQVINMPCLLVVACYLVLRRMRGRALTTILVF